MPPEVWTSKTQPRKGYLMKKTTALIKALEAELSPLYLVPQAQGTHDLQHVLRMQRAFGEIASLIPTVDEDEYHITVWVHNVDRCPGFQSQIRVKGLVELFHRLLAPGELGTEIEHCIITAILEHSKKDDGPDDSPLLQALRLADKWDRIGLLGCLSPFEWLGCKMPSYNPENPFGYGSTAEGGYKTSYQALYRILEWYGMYPMIRELIRRHPWRFENLLWFVRAFGREISEAHGVPNTSEDDIRRCLGEYYVQWTPKEVYG